MKAALQQTGHFDKEDQEDLQRKRMKCQLPYVRPPDGWILFTNRDLVLITKLWSMPLNLCEGEAI